MDKPYLNISKLAGGNALIFLVFWLIQINLSWLAYQLTNSPLKLGLLGFFINLPILVVIPFAGVLSDTFNRKTILMLSQLFYLLPNLILFTLVLTDTINYWNMTLTGMMYGLFFAFGRPSSDALVYDIATNQQQLKIGVSANASTSEIAMLFAPLISQLMIQWFKFPSIFLTCAAANLFAMILFSRLQLTTKHTNITTQSTGFLLSLSAGIKHIISESTIFFYMLLISLSLGLIISLQLQFPAIIIKLHHGVKANLYHFYYFSAIGGICGSLLIILTKHSKRASLYWLMSALSLQAIFVIMLAFANRFVLAYIAVFFIASCGMIATIIGTISIQNLVEDSKRGRVMSLLAMMRIGCIPIVSLIIGIANTLLGITGGLTVIGAAYLLSIVMFVCFTKGVLANKTL